MHKQMQQIVYELAPSTCVLQNFYWSLSFLISLPNNIFVTYLSPFVIYF
jgi:hypothetical protein